MTDLTSDCSPWHGAVLCLGPCAQGDFLSEDFCRLAVQGVLRLAVGVWRARPDRSEMEILMRALRDMNMPKFIYADVPLFNPTSCQRTVARDLSTFNCATQPNPLNNQKRRLCYCSAPPPSAPPFLRAPASVRAPPRATRRPCWTWSVRWSSYRAWKTSPAWWARFCR